MHRRPGGISAGHRDCGWKRRWRGRWNGIVASPPANRHAHSPTARSLAILSVWHDEVALSLLWIGVAAKLCGPWPFAAVECVPRHGPADGDGATLPAARLCLRGLPAGAAACGRVTGGDLHGLCL